MLIDRNRSAWTAAGRASLLLVLCLGLTACPRPVKQPPPAPNVPPPTPSEPAPPPVPEGAAIYEIAAQDSVLHILVYRGGTFARLGHNHVMSSKAVTGRVWLRPQWAQSGFDLSFPVADLIVDDPEARRAAGSDFPLEIPASDKEGTRKNMLRKEVLDAATYPRVTVKSASLSGSIQAPQITASITIKDTTRDVIVPARIVVNGDRLTAEGEFDIQQTAFGMKPFSVALGALEVQDRLHVRFNLVAVKR
ncbi:YceI family protein [Steroidobacter sp.]|uniref:YceI family protein n=1 Tax=Steroidobacter sp. TaxID=1978227 RepID=UPI001A5C1305|nr:YceI family protein [Steroidobacter sp.]MBL8267425.1 YceI family protein [Steroidobacter sp.]